MKLQSLQLGHRSIRSTAIAPLRLARAIFCFRASVRKNESRLLQGFRIVNVHFGSQQDIQFMISNESNLQLLVQSRADFPVFVRSSIG